MKNIIATWICVDNAANATYFPSAKGSSSDARVQDIYWRCICCFFSIARYFNPTATLAFFSNTDLLPVVDKTPVKDVLEKNDVKFYVTPFNYITPEGYFDKWRNQFYEFSILEYISDHPDFGENDNFLLLDSDCIITDNLQALFEEVKSKKCITYIIDYSEHHKINGNSRLDMQSIFQELSGNPVVKCPDYHAGEFYASGIGVAKKLVKDFYLVWDKLMIRHSAGLSKLHEEAHVLSYLFFINGYRGGEANKYIKRLWTDPTSYRNIEEQDAELLIWHLPAEKRFGFKKLFTWLQSAGFDISTAKVPTLRQRLRQTFLVPFIPLTRRPYYMGKSLFKKMFA